MAELWSTFLACVHISKICRSTCVRIHVPGFSHWIHDWFVDEMYGGWIMIKHGNYHPWLWCIWILCFWFRDTITLSFHADSLSFWNWNYWWRNLDHNQIYGSTCVRIHVPGFFRWMHDWFVDEMYGGWIMIKHVNRYPWLWCIWILCFWFWDIITLSFHADSLSFWN